MCREAHLIDVLQLINDLIDDRVSSLHFHFRVGTLSLDPVADHTQSVAVNEASTKDRAACKCFHTSIRPVKA